MGLAILASHKQKALGEPSASIAPFPAEQVSHDRFLPGLKEFTDAVHEHGAKIIPQMAHPGPESLAPYFYGTDTKGPSPVMCHTTKKMCQEMSIEDIQAVVVEFGEASRRAREAGFDGVELHAAHSYMLVGSFLSGLRNRRSDRYGGSIEARLQLALEVIASIRERAGEDFPIVMRISGDEYMPGGRTLRETQFIAPILAEAGVTAFHVSAGVYPHTSWHVMPPTGSPLGSNVALSAGLKKVVDVPVMVVGRINDPLFAEDVLRNEEADMVVMGRGILPWRYRVRLRQRARVPLKVIIELPHLSRVDDKELVTAGAQQAAIVRHEYHRAGVFLQGACQRVPHLDIDVQAIMKLLREGAS